jgi:NIMA (never in mitosis gene a)-related kinase
MAAVGQRNEVQGLLQKHGYAYIKTIGEGSYGKAHLVQARDSSKAVCKMVNVSKASSKEKRDALQEGQLLASLKHPYIVRYCESFVEDGWFCLFMDYCNGGDLTKQIETHKHSRVTFPEKQVLKWFTQSAMALNYIHDRHILHRDLKPSNFFLSKNGNVKIGDFGIAKALSNANAYANTQIGTPYYLSPEVCQEKPYSWGSDIWALGCILYELCALKVPFEATSVPSLVQKIVRGPIPHFPSSYSPFLRVLFAPILSRDPSKRPSTSDVLANPQIQATVVKLQGEEAAEQPSRRPPSAGPSSRPPSAGPPSARRGREEPRGPGQFQKGDGIEYWSGTHNKWVPGVVSDVDGNGNIIIDLKPRTWIGRDEQVKKIRLRQGGGGRPASKDRPPSAAAYKERPYSARGPRPSSAQRGGGA